jgi:hypothetical protein
MPMHLLHFLRTAPLPTLLLLLWIYMEKMAVVDL